MKYLIVLSFLLISAIGNSQNNPSGFPTQKNVGWQEWGWAMSDSGAIIANRIPNFTPRYPGTLILHQQLSDSSYKYWTGGRWLRLLTSKDSAGFISQNISNTSLIANGSYTQNWNHQQLVIDSIDGQLLLRATSIGDGGSRGKEFRLKWEGPSTGDGYDNWSLIGALKRAGSSTDSIFRGIKAQSSALQLISVNALNTVTFNINNAFSATMGTFTTLTSKQEYIQTDTNKIVLYSDKDSVLIKGLKSATTADTILALGPVVGTLGNQIIKVPLSSLGGGTVTSVGLSMPAAFSVSGSPVTGSGTLSVSGVGTSLQYIKGNGTLGTFDTAAIPNFYLKVRSELSANTPITYNSTTGAIGINNANTSGTKGAATFSSSSFSDNGSGTISLNSLITPGSCLNCQLTLGADGRVNSYADGAILAISNANGAGDTLVVSGDTVKRLNASFGLISIPTASSITLKVDTSQIATQYDLSLVNNGLSRSGDTTQLGQLIGTSGNPASLLSNREIPFNGFNLVLTGTGRLAIGTASPSSNTKFTSIATGTDKAIQATASTGTAISASSSNNAITGQSLGAFKGIQGLSIGGVGVEGQGGLNGIGGRFTTLVSGNSDSNTVLELQLDPTGGGVSNGIGQRIMFRLPFASGGFGNESGQIRNYFSNAISGSQNSNFSFHLVNAGVSARKSLLASTGQWTWDGYTGSNFQTIDSSFNSLVIDGSGNVYKRAGGSGGGGSGSAALTYKNVGFGGIGNTLSLGESQFQYDSIANILKVDSINLLNARINQDPFNADSTVFFGTSITAGTGQTAGNRYSTITSNRLNSFEANYGVSGAKLVVEGIANEWKIPFYDRTKYRWLILEWGVNDINDATCDSTKFDTTYRNNYIPFAISSRGWPSDRIIMLAPSYINPTLLPTATLVKQAQFRSATQSISTDKGTKWVDIYSAELFRNPSNLLVDGLHPNDYGASIYLNSIYNTISDSVMSTNQNVTVNGYVELQRLKLRNSDTANYKAEVIGRDSSGNIVQFTKDQIIQNSTTLPTPQGSSISLVGKAFFGNITSPAAVDVVQANGSIRGTMLRATGSAPTGLTGAGIELAYASGVGLLYGYDRDASLPKTLSINVFGKPVLINTISENGSSSELLQINGGGINAQFGRFTTSVGGTGLTGSALEIGLASGTGAIYAFDRSGATGLNLCLGYNLSPIVIVGANSTNGTAGFQVNSKSYFNDEINIGNTTDQGSYKIQNTGGLYQNGSVNLQSVTAPPSSYNILVHGLTDSVVYQIPASFFLDSAIWKQDGTMTANHTLSGNGKILNLGSSGSKLLNLNMTASGLISFTGQFLYSIDAFSSDADHTVTSTAQICEITDALSTNRTLTLPTATLNGTLITVVTHFSSGSNHFSLSAAVTDNATGSTFTQLDWGKTYDFLYDSSLAWRLIRKY